MGRLNTSRQQSQETVPAAIFIQISGKCLGTSTPRVINLYISSSTQWTRCLGVQGSGVRDTEFLVWMGDFNYRINGIARTDIIDKSRRGDLRDLVLAVSALLLDHPTPLWFPFLLLIALQHRAAIRCTGNICYRIPATFSLPVQKSQVTRGGPDVPTSVPSKDVRSATADDPHLSRWTGC